MKIAIFTDTFLPQVNGVVTATINLAKGLSRKNHQVFIICPKFKNETKEFEHPSIKIIRINSIPAYLYEDLRFTSLINSKLIKLLKKEKIDIIHFQTPMTLGFQAILISKILKVPLVGTFNTFFSDPQYLKHLKINSKLAQNMTWVYTKIFYNKCNLISSPSESTRDILIDKGFKKPIKKISYGIDFSIFDNSKWKEVKNKYNKDGKIVVYIGRISHEKNLLYLLECMNTVLKRVTNTKMLIIGDGPQMKEIKEKIASLQLSDKVILTGKIPHEQLVKSSIFKASDLFVTASTTETFGITTLETQVNGLPCIAIKAKGTEDLIKDGINGYLVKRGDKQKFANRVIELLTNPSIYKEMQKNTKELVKEHDLKKVIILWEKEYKKLIGEKI